MRHVTLCKSGSDRDGAVSGAKFPCLRPNTTDAATSHADDLQSDIFFQCANTRTKNSAFIARPILLLCHLIPWPHNSCSRQTTLVESSSPTLTLVHTLPPWLDETLIPTKAPGSAKWRGSPGPVGAAWEGWPLESQMASRHTRCRVIAPCHSADSSLTCAIGVMRFLQTEWHRHERDRNAWEIEREEMKNRIAILEGETRTSKGIRTSLERHVKLLEVALKRERERVRSADKGEGVESQKGAKELARDELRAVGKGMRSLLCSCDLSGLTWANRFISKQRRPF